MPGQNLLTYRTRLRLLLDGGAYDSAASVNAPDPLLFELLNESQAFIQDKLQLVVVSDETVDLVASTAVYDIPLGVLGTKITQIDWLNASSEWQSLVQVPYSAIQDGTDVSNGTPTQWAVVAHSTRQIALFPTPDTTTSNALRIAYIGQATPLTRVYQPSSSTFTAAVTNASTAVTFSGQVVATNIVAGDEFGVVPADNQLPFQWYTVSSFTEASPSTMVLKGDGYAQITAGTATFVTAQVSDLETNFPGKLREAMILLAASKWYLGSNLAQSQEFEARAMGIIATFSRDDNFVLLPGDRPTLDTSFLRS